MKFKEAISIFLLSALLTGCCSIVGQSIFPVTINSNPSGANITITDEHGLQMFNGTTPTTITLTAGESYFHAKSYQIKFSKPGYGNQVAVLKADLDGWYFGNILFGGLIGALIVDPITGKMWKLPLQSFTSLSPVGAIPTNSTPAGTTPQKTSLNKKAPELQIVCLDQVPVEMRKNMIRIN